MKAKKYFKAVLSMVLVYTMITAVFPSAAASVNTRTTYTYPDVSEGDWYYENVRYVTENGIMNGVAENRFAPLDTMTRSMCVTILHRMAGEPVADSPHYFEDVKDGLWYSGAVAWAYETRITTGKTRKIFAPDDTVSRAEFVTFLYRYADYSVLGFPESRDGNVTDETSIPAYASDAVTAMYRSEIINGRSGNAFDPTATITRAEAAAVIDRFTDNTEKYELVCFMGNSITIQSKTTGHFRALADGMPVKVTSISSYGFSLYNHYTWFNKSPKDKRFTQRADIIILQEGGGSFPSIGENERISSILDSDEGLALGLPNGFYRGENIVDNIKEQIGRDKEYYAFTAAHFIGKFDETDTEALLEIKKIFEEDYSLPLIYIPDISAFNEDLGLTMGHIFPDGLHPTKLMGYCMALTLFCDIYDVSPLEQNNGLLEPDDIPGDTQAEKDELMIKLKKTVQDILDVQDITKQETSP